MQHARPMVGVIHNPKKGASMRLSRLAMGLWGVIVLSLAVLVGVGTAQSTARKGQPTLTIATVNNPDMIVMQALSSKFTSKYGIKVKYVTLPENTLRQKVTSDVATGGGQFDIATVGTYDVPIWAKNKWLVSLQDRKSTRLNSSHPVISYAVFCLKQTNFCFFTTFATFFLLPRHVRSLCVSARTLVFVIGSLGILRHLIGFVGVLLIYRAGRRRSS